MVWLIMNGVDADEQNLTIQDRIPYLEGNKVPMEQIVAMKSPRILKTHMPYGCLPVPVETGRVKVI